MAHARGKILCSTCKKASGIMTCRGCRKDFCYRHVTEHRQELNVQMDELAINHDQLQQTIVEQEADPNCHPLMKQIAEWEEQTTDDVRKQLLDILAKYRTQVANELARLTNELKSARHEDDYVETDLKQWTKKLDQLKASLDAGHTIDFSPDQNDAAQIAKDYINDASTDVFFEINGDVRIQEGGKVAVHGPASEIVAGRCRGEYSLGQHRFRFRIERRSNGVGFVCGIVSKSTPMELIINTIVPNAHGYPDTRSLAYKSLNDNVVCSFNKSDNQFQLNGIYELLINCDRRSIRLTNEQTNATQTIYVDLTTFPFPWQFFVTLTYVNDRVRLC